jgi:hypothetical protein
MIREPAAPRGMSIKRRDIGSPVPGRSRGELLGRADAPDAGCTPVPIDQHLPAFHRDDTKPPSGPCAYLGWPGAGQHKSDLPSARVAGLEPGDLQLRASSKAGLAAWSRCRLVLCLRVDAKLSLRRPGPREFSRQSAARSPSERADGGWRGGACAARLRRVSRRCGSRCAAPARSPCTDSRGRSVRAHRSHAV